MSPGKSAERRYARCRETTRTPCAGSICHVLLQLCCRWSPPCYSRLHGRPGGVPGCPNRARRGNGGSVQPKPRPRLPHSSLAGTDRTRAASPRPRMDAHAPLVTTGARPPYRSLGIRSHGRGYEPAVMRRMPFAGRSGGTRPRGPAPSRRTCDSGSLRQSATWAPPRGGRPAPSNRDRSRHFGLLSARPIASSKLRTKRHDTYAIKQGAPVEQHPIKSLMQLRNRHINRLMSISRTAARIGRRVAGGVNESSPSRSDSAQSSSPAPCSSYSAATRLPTPSWISRPEGGRDGAASETIPPSYTCTSRVADAGA